MSAQSSVKSHYLKARRPGIDTLFEAVVLLRRQSQPNAPSSPIPGRMVELFVCAWACTLVNHNVLLKATWVWMCIMLPAS